VTFLRAKSIDTLYDEVVAHDLVVVPDAPRASAINRRLDEPRLGPFAVTPRRLAAGRRERAEDRLAFLEIVDRLDRDWTQIAYEVGNILQCWEHQRRLDAVFEYDTYVTDTTREAVAAVDSLDTTSGRLAAFQIDADRDVAVVGEAQLTPLERSILPDEYATVDPFHDAAFDRPPFHVFGSKTAVVETVVDAIDADSADDVAVVLDGSSAYSPLVESALEAAEIPFYGGPGFVDDPDHRAFLALCRVVNAGSDTRVREARPLFAHLGDPPTRADDEKRLAALDDHGGALGWVRAVRDDVDEHTFETLLAAFGDRIGRDLVAFRTELDQLGIVDAPVTSDRVDRLAFYLQTYEVPVDRQNEGVLLADATSAAYVGRPTVFHLGLDDGWTPAPPNRPWVDREGQYTRNVRDFQLLLQSGRQQYYLVTDAAGGSPVTPALYLQDLLDESFERFTDLDHVTHTTRGWSGGDGFDRTPVDDVDPEPAETISQSSLASYVNSPRDYFFSRLVEAPDRDYFVEGTLFHDFAEFCVAHPDFVDDAVAAEAVDIVLDEVEPLLRGVDEPTHCTEYRVACETIREYVATHHTKGDPELADGTARRDENAFARHYSRPVDTPHTERWFDDADLGLKGKIDLVATPTELVDHKSGTRGSPRSVVRQSALDPPDDTPDFQALAYLTYWRSRRPDTTHEFTFFHFLETLDDAVAGDAALDETLTTVTSHPTTFVEHVRSRATFDHLASDDAANDCQKTFEQATYDDWQAAFATATPPASSDSAELLDSAFADDLIDRMRAVVGEYKYVTSGCEQALRELARIYGRNYFAGDLDAFEAFVDDRLAELTARRAGAERFPVEGLGGEPNERRLDHPDLLLEGSR
jgi:hypothetical protein